MKREDLKRAWASMPPAGQPHPSDEDLLSRLVPGKGVEDIEAHLAACSSCRGTLAELSRLEEGPSFPIPRWTWAAAAAVLAAASLSLWGKDDVRPPLPVPPAPPRISPASPPILLPASGGAWTGGEALAGRSVLLSLKAGGTARLSGSSPMTVSLDLGSLRIESPDEPVTLEAGTLRVELAEGELLAEVEPPAGRGAWFLREAWAGEGSAIRVALRRGTARIGDRKLLAGDSLGWDGHRLEEIPPLPWAESGSWRTLGAGTEAVRESARILLPSPPEGYVLEALVRKCSHEAELGAVFTAAGSGWEVPVGANLMPRQEGWSRLRITVDETTASVTLGAKEILSLASADLHRKLLPSREAAGAGVRSWGGSIEIRSVRWRPLR